MLGTQLRGGGWTSVLGEGTAGSENEGTSFLSGGGGKIVFIITR